MPELTPSVVRLSRPKPPTSFAAADRHAASPLMLCDRLITLAQEADRAGLAVTASHLVHLARGVFDEGPRPLLA